MACHCSQCRKQSGHFTAATDTADSALTVHDADGLLRWYAASEDAQRGFCSQCESSLFWKANGSHKTSILAGSLHGETGLTLERHIYVSDKGDYYDLNDGLRTFETSDSHDPRPQTGS
ncbi:MAG: GFA family protein [Pseudomonadota bacterium]